MSVLKKLQSACTLKDLAEILGYKAASLSYIVYKLPPHKKYTQFTIPKKGGGNRQILAPREQLKILQRHLANVLNQCRKEIDHETGRKSLSHGFRKEHSIITNARCHKRRRYVLNIDLQDFFPSFNFGRVRGYFIRDKYLNLHEKVATIIAQIACHENILPQGSPCSPIISDLIAQVLDVRLARLAKKNGLTYSRYADDLTFSTNQKSFPTSVASAAGPGSSTWVLGDELIKTIEHAGFTINSNKTRMQYRMSRQVVTGLIVNDKVNIRAEYYKTARAMCHSLFNKGTYSRPTDKQDAPTDVKPEGPTPISSLRPLHGILSHIHHVKNAPECRKAPKTEQSKHKKQEKIMIKMINAPHFRSYIFNFLFIAISLRWIVHLLYAKERQTLSILSMLLRSYLRSILSSEHGQELLSREQSRS